MRCSSPVIPRRLPLNKRAQRKQNESHLSYVLRTACHRWQGSSWSSDLPAWHRRDPGLHAGGHLRHGQGHVAAGHRRHRRGNHSGQHLPPVAASGHRSDQEARRPARFHAVERPDPHRLRRFPGVQPGRHAQDQGGGRDLRLPGRRRESVHGPGRVDAGAARPGLGHRDDLRRMHAVPG